jgi:hypothetical protein
MKKLILAIAAGLPMLAGAQILNPGFESSRPNGGPANWGKIILQPVPCDVALGYDSVYFQSTDAHTGNYALELRNASCDNSSFLAGSAILMQNDTNYFSLGIPYTDRPDELTFFYKLFQTGGDIGHVSIQLVDDVNAITIANAEYDINQPASQYAALSVPLTYYDAGIPTHIEIIFSIENLVDHVHFGTRFLVDDISTLTTGLINAPVTNALATLFPNPNTGSVTIKSIQTEPVQLTVYNSIGQVVMSDKVAVNTALSLDNLNTGIYHYAVRTATKLLGSGKMIKE